MTIGTKCIVKGQSWAGVWCVVSVSANGMITAEDEYGERHRFSKQELERV